jgi:hypothetical protein
LESGENMKIIISKNSPFIVEDEDGNVLYTFQPIDDKEIDKMTLDWMNEILINNYMNGV